MKKKNYVRMALIYSFFVTI